VLKRDGDKLRKSCPVVHGSKRYPTARTVRNRD
jgi:hypothetical protein